MVLIVGLRGAAPGDRSAQTFGLREAMDVRAGVEMLRRRPLVDPQRIAIVGTGTGATAALLALRDDPGIRALVLDEPVRHVDQILTAIGPRHPWLAALRPMCKWAFEIVYDVNADDVELLRHDKLVARDNVLLLDAPGAQRFDTPAGAQQVVAFLRDRLQ